MGNVEEKMWEVSIFSRYFFFLSLFFSRRATDGCKWYDGCIITFLDMKTDLLQIDLNNIGIYIFFSLGKAKKNSWRIHSFSVNFPISVRTSASNSRSDVVIKTGNDFLQTDIRTPVIFIFFSASHSFIKLKRKREK